MLTLIRDFFFPRPVDFSSRKRGRAAAVAPGAGETAPMAAAPAEPGK